MVLPGFEGRLGRLGFLGRSIGLGLAMGVATVVLTLLLAFGGHASPGLRLLFVAGIVGPVALYAGLSLQVRRLNDMGWPALPVIGGWFLVGILDVGLAHGVPALARPGGAAMASVQFRRPRAFERPSERLFEGWSDFGVERDQITEWVRPSSSANRPAKSGAGRLGSSILSEM